MRLSQSLRSRTLLFALIMVLPAFVVVLHGTFEQHRELTAFAEQQLQELGRVVTLEQSQAIELARDLLITLAQLPSIRDNPRAKECNLLLAGILSRHPQYTNLGLIGLDGSVRCSAHPFTGDLNLSDRDYFRQALQTGEFSIGQYQIGRITHRGSLNFGYPVVDHAERAVGVVFAAWDLDRLNRAVADVSDSKDTTTITIVDGADRVLARHPDVADLVGQVSPQMILIRKNLDGQVSGISRGLDVDGTERLFATLPLDPSRRSEVRLFLGMSTDQVYAGVRHRSKRDLSILFAVMLSLGAIAWWGSSTLVLAPISALASAARRLSAGEKGVRTGLPHGESELGHLAGTFDEMAAHLEQREVEIWRVNRVLRTLSAGNRTLLHAANESELLDAMCRIPVDEGGYRAAWIGHLETDAKGTRIRRAVHAGAVTLPEEFPIAGPRQGDASLQSAIRDGSHAIGRLSPDTVASPERVAERLWVARFPLHDEDSRIGIFSILTDASDGFALEEIQLLKEMAADLAYGMHSIRIKSERQRALAAIKHMAYHDDVTGLQNLRALVDVLRRSIRAAETNQSSLALLLLGIDHFRDFQETLGCHQGDALLRSVADRIRHAVSDDELVARTADATFCIVLPGHDAIGTQRTAANIERLMRQPFVFGDLHLDVQTSIGIAIYPAHGADHDSLLRCGGRGLERARLNGEPWALCIPESTQDATRRLLLGNGLSRAIDNGELLLYGQPTVDMRTGRVSSIEVLLRWQHSTYGMVSPMEFVTLAERTGLIKPLTYWVLNTSLQQASARRQRAQPAGIPFAVNLSAYNLRDPALVEKISGMLRTWEISPAELHLELTESALMEDPDRALSLLTELHDMGVGLFVDDFGTGYSSLRYLQRLPIRAIKIDKCFVTEIAEDAVSAKIVGSTIELAHALGFHVVAEGVERRDAWHLLQRLGCDHAQGYYIAPPMPMDELEVWLDHRLQQIADA